MSGEDRRCMPPAAKPDVIIWHNPRCSKSRQTLALLRERGVEPAIRPYLDQPPTAREVETLLAMLDADPRDLVRDGEPEFKATGATAAGLTRRAVVDLIVRHPILLQRPVVVAGGKAAIGRPPEAILALFGNS
jgi:arsenate reductase